MNRLPMDGPLTLDVQSTPPREGPEIYILRLKANQHYSFTIFSEHVWGINVHWNGQKSEPHFKEDNRCPGCIARRPKRWKGYLHCFAHELGQEVFLELTPHSAHSLEGQLGAGTSYRGNRIAVKRGKGDNGRLTITLLTASPNPTALPLGKDPQASILALWGFSADHPFGGKELPTKFSRNGTNAGHV